MGILESLAKFSTEPGIISNNLNEAFKQIMQTFEQTAMTKICIPGQEPIGVSVTHENEDSGIVEFSLETVISANPETIEALKNNRIGHGI